MTKDGFKSEKPIRKRYYNSEEVGKILGISIELLRYRVFNRFDLTEIHRDKETKRFKFTEKQIHRLR